jgi:hypothetical protein
MAPIWKPQPHEVIENWLNTILTEASDSLNDWETKFIDDMTIRIANRWQLSQAQEEALERIYAEKTK